MTGINAIDFNCSQCDRRNVVDKEHPGGLGGDWEGTIHFFCDEFCHDKWERRLPDTLPGKTAIAPKPVLGSGRTRRRDAVKATKEKYK